MKVTENKNGLRSATDFKEDKFRVRGPSYQRWTSTESATPESWKDMLNGVMGLNSMKPNEIAGFRVQINFKRAAKLAKER